MDSLPGYDTWKTSPPERVTDTDETLTRCVGCSNDFTGYDSPYGDRCLRCSAFRAFEVLEGLARGKPNVLESFETAREVIWAFVAMTEKEVRS